MPVTAVLRFVYGCQRVGRRRPQPVIASRNVREGIPYWGIVAKTVLLKKAVVKETLILGGTKL
jgi:hypothetical protein